MFAAVGLEEDGRRPRLRNLQFSWRLGLRREAGLLRKYRTSQNFLDGTV